MPIGKRKRDDKRQRGNPQEKGNDQQIRSGEVEKAGDHVPSSFRGGNELYHLAELFGLPSREADEEEFESGKQESRKEREAGRGGGGE